MQSMMSPDCCIPEGNSEQEHLLETFPSTNGIDRMKLFILKMAYGFLP